MSRRTPELLLLDILESIEKIKRYTAGMTQEQFAADSKTIDAVLRNIEIIGEAAGRLPGELPTSILTSPGIRFAACATA